MNFADVGTIVVFADDQYSLRLGGAEPAKQYLLDLVHQQQGFLPGVHIRQGQHLARLGRKSLSFSKSVELHDKVIGHYLNIKHYQ